MSTRERAWRFVAPAFAASDQLRLRHHSYSFTRGAWPERIFELVAGLNIATTTHDAGRIAEGELCFWGRSSFVVPMAPAWNRDPFANTAVGCHSVYDPKPLWELQRQQHLFPLAAGAHLADRVDWQGVAHGQLCDWVATNPRAGGGPGWSSAYESAHRLVQWAWAVPLVASSIEPEVLRTIALSYAQQTRFVLARPSRYSSANNHRVAELVGLLHAEALSGDLNAWRRLWVELENHAAAQMYADGGSREQATGYFLYVLEMLWVAGLLAEAMGRNLGKLRDQLQRRVAWATATGDADLEPPVFGDDAEDRIIRLEYFQPRRAGDIVDRAVGLLDGRLTLKAPSVTRPIEASRALESGLVILRGTSGGQRARVAFDVGQLGFGELAAHGHADALSVVVENHGTTLLRDSGTGSYSSRKVRDLLRSTAAHNTVEVAGRSQAEVLGPHLWGRRYNVSVEHVALTEGYDYARAQHDGYLRDFGAIHTRSVIFLKPDFVVVVDRIKAERPQDIRLYWHLMSGKHPTELGSRASLFVVAEPSALPEEEPWPYSARFTRWSEAPRWTWQVFGSDVRFASVIALAGGTHQLAHRSDGDVDELVVNGPTPFRIIERWHGLPEISA